MVVSSVAAINEGAGSKPHLATPTSGGTPPPRGRSGSPSSSSGGRRPTNTSLVAKRPEDSRTSGGGGSHAAGGGRRPVKIWNSGRTVRKALVVSTYEEFQRKGREKLGFTPEEPMSIVLEGDGTQVDDGEYFQTLPENSIFMFLRSGESWHPTGSDSVKADSRSGMTFWYVVVLLLLVAIFLALASVAALVLVFCVKSTETNCNCESSHCNCCGMLGFICSWFCVNILRRGRGENAYHTVCIDNMEDFSDEDECSSQCCGDVPEHSQCLANPG